MTNWELKKKLINLKRESGQVSRKIQDVIDELDGSNGNRRVQNYQQKPNINQRTHYREDR
jgi:hypothetical protein